MRPWATIVAIYLQYDVGTFESLERRPQVELAPDGKTWRYLGTEVDAVAVTEVTLQEVVDPRIVGRGDAEPEAVIFSLSEVRATPQLAFVIGEDVSVQLDGDVEPLYMVPWSVWQERAGEVVDTRLKEFDGEGIGQRLAAAERRYRFLKKDLDAASRLRAQLLALGAAAGLTRRELADSVSLTPARIQQLLDGMGAEDKLAAQEFLSEAANALSLLTSDSPWRDTLARKLGGDRAEELIAELLAVGILRDTDGVLELSSDGQSIAGTALQASSSSRKSGR